MFTQKTGWPTNVLIHRNHLPDQMNEYLELAFEYFTRSKNQNISLLDFTGIGSKIDYISKKLGNEAWPVQLNFAMINRIWPKKDLETMLEKNYFNTKACWKNRSESKEGKKPDCASYYNFNEILDNFLEKFLLAYVSSFRVPKDVGANDMWVNISEKVFKTSATKTHQTDSDLKLFLDCSFQKQNNWNNIFQNSLIGCKDFDPTLTTNGICYAFNGITDSKIWRKSDITTAFNRAFKGATNKNTFKFRGTGPVEGSF